jgi:hypothetical protein
MGADQVDACAPVCRRLGMCLAKAPGTQSSSSDTDSPLRPSRALRETPVEPGSVVLQTLRKGEYFLFRERSPALALLCRFKMKQRCCSLSMSIFIRVSYPRALIAQRQCSRACVFARLESLDLSRHVYPQAVAVANG